MVPSVTGLETEPRVAVTSLLPSTRTSGRSLNASVVEVAGGILRIFAALPPNWTLDSPSDQRR